MSEVKQWSATAASNSSAAPDGFPEGMLPSGVNDSAREVMAAVRKVWNDSEFRDLHYGATIVRVGDAELQVQGANYTAFYTAGRRIKITGDPPSPQYAFVVASTFSTHTNVTLMIDNGVALTTSLTKVEVHQSPSLTPGAFLEGSATEAAHKAAADPGVSETQNLPTTLLAELQQLRYGIERLALGVGAGRVDGGGSTTAGWFDVPARGRNLLRNPRFIAMSGAAVHLWDTNGTPDTLELVALAPGDGLGSAVHVNASADEDGIEQTVTGLKPNTRYLVGCRVKPGTATMRLATSGADATSDFRDLDILSAVGGGLWEVLGGVIETDSVPNDIMVALQGTGATSDFRVSDVGLFECSETPLAPVAAHAIQAIRSTEELSKFNADDFVYATGLDVTLYVPGPGCQIRVSACVSWALATATNLVARIVESKDGVGDVAKIRTPSGYANGSNVQLLYLNPNPVPGSTYRYRVDARAGAAGVAYCPNAGTLGVPASVGQQNSWLLVELIPPG